MSGYKDKTPKTNRPPAARGKNKTVSRKEKVLDVTLAEVTPDSPLSSVSRIGRQTWPPTCHGYCRR